MSKLVCDRIKALLHDEIEQYLPLFDVSDKACAVFQERVNAIVSGVELAARFSDLQHKVIDLSSDGLTLKEIALTVNKSESWVVKEKKKIQLELNASTFSEVILLVKKSFDESDIAYKR